MAILNLIIRPFTTLILYRIYVERANAVGAPLPTIFGESLCNLHFCIKTEFVSNCVCPRMGTFLLLLVLMCFCFCMWHSPEGPIWRHCWCSSPERAPHWYHQSSGVSCERQDAAPVSQLRWLQFGGFNVGYMGVGCGHRTLPFIIKQSQRKNPWQRNLKTKCLQHHYSCNWVCVTSFLCAGLQLWKTESSTRGKFYMSLCLKLYKCGTKKERLQMIS
jgi:hypothetical protein